MDKENAKELTKDLLSDMMDTESVEVARPPVDLGKRTLVSLTASNESSGNLKVGV